MDPSIPSTRCTTTAAAQAPPLDFTVLHCCELPSSALCEDGTPRGRLLTLLQCRGGRGLVEVEGP